MASRLEINKDSVIADIIREYPECIEILDRHAMPCRTCMGADTDTLEDGAMMHDVDVSLVVRDLRECVQRNQSIVE